jgi:NAD+-dependent protein deacetylase SIR2
MGNETSSMTAVADDTPPQVLERRDVQSVAKYVNQRGVRRIIVMVGRWLFFSFLFILARPYIVHNYHANVREAGAGISTSAGIPDFRSPDTGLYANLAHLGLPHPEAMFDINFFKENPQPFYALARELYPGRYRPTIAHCFIKLLYNKGRLLKLFTQNIDCLEREAGLPGEMIIDAHGSFASQRCIDCRSFYPRDLMRKAVENGDVPHCHLPNCNGIVKPDIVFFGEQLPEEFFLNRHLPAAADLCIVMGTSLSVWPFAGLPALCQDNVPRILINQERVGGLGSRPDDVLLLGDGDAGVRQVAQALGWLEELEALWEQTNPDQTTREEQAVPPPTRDERLRNEVDRLAEEVEKTLNVSTAHQHRLREDLTKEDVPIDQPTPGEDTRGEVGPKSADPTLTAHPTTTTDGGGGLDHVYPHLVKKSPL